MGCACGTTKDSSVKGCQNNGTCGTGGCNKMNVFDWLSDMEVPAADKFKVVEVRFKNGRKDFYRNTDNHELYTGDPIIVEVQNGHHLGYVSMQGELVRLQMQKKNVADDGEIKKIYRKANQRDLEKLQEVQKREMPTLYRTREIVKERKLNMKVSDIEFQADNTKATFYYSAEERVDFRELIKVLATEFKIRVEMRQINLRQEAGRLGGIGVCGRELCCSTWLTDFKNVTTGAARYQNLSLNPTKLSGQCGRLKCCLNYELETYMEALQHIPKIEAPLLTQQGEAKLQKTDIFRKIMWFGYDTENTWFPINIERVNQILELNRAGKKPATLEKDAEAVKEPIATLNSDLVSMDNKFRDKTKKKKKKKPNRQGNNQNPNRPNNPNAGEGNTANRPNNPSGTQGSNPNANRSENPRQGNNRNRGNNPGRNQGNRPNNPNRPPKE